MARFPLSAVYPYDKEMAQREAVNAVGRLLPPVLFILVGALIIRFLLLKDGFHLFDHVNELYLIFIYVLGWAFSIYGIVFSFLQQASFHVNDLGFWVAKNDAAISQYLSLEPNKRPKEMPGLSSGEQFIPFSDIAMVLIDKDGIKLVANHPNPLTGKGRMFISSTVEGYAELRDRINVLGDQYLWEFPSDKRRSPS